MTPILDLEQFIADNADGDDGWADAVRRLVARAHGRGDIVVVYRNSDLGHPDLGTTKITTYGSADSQLEVAQFPDGPPHTLPDMGGEINWRYTLEGQLQ